MFCDWLRPTRKCSKNFREKKIAQQYKKLLKTFDIAFQECEDKGFNSFWMVLLMKLDETIRDNIRDFLK